MTTITTTTATLMVIITIEAIVDQLRGEWRGNAGNKSNNNNKKNNKNNRPGYNNDDICS